MKKALIFGGENFASMLRWYVEKYDGRKVDAYVVDEKYHSGDRYDGLPLLKTQDVLSRYDPRETEIYLALGYAQMNNVRKDKYLLFSSAGYEMPNFIHPTVCNEAAEFGCANIVLEDCNICPFAKIGNANLIWNGVSICHNVEIGSFNTLAVGSSLAGFSKCGDNCFIGENAAVKNTVAIADYTFVGATAYINADTSRGSAYLISGTKPMKGLSSEDVMRFKC